MVLFNHANAFFNRPDVHQNAGRAVNPGQVKRPKRTGDVRDRGGHKNDIVWPDLPGIAHRTGAVIVAIMGVQHALGFSGGPRCVHYHHHGRGIDDGQRGFVSGCDQKRHVPSQLTRITHHHDVAQFGQFSAQPRQHLGMIMLAKRAGHENQFGPAIGQNVTKLGLAVDRRNRVDDKAGHARGERNNCALNPIGQLEGNYVAWLQSACQKEGGKFQRFVPALAARQPVLAFDQ